MRGRSFFSKIPNTSVFCGQAKLHKHILTAIYIKCISKPVARLLIIMSVVYCPDFLAKSIGQDMHDYWIMIIYHLSDYSQVYHYRIWYFIWYNQYQKAITYRKHMEDDLTKKQAYLYKEIIEGGYNPQSFQQYLIANDEIAGDNLELWSMQALISIVDKFKKANAEPDQPEQTHQGNQQGKKEESATESVSDKNMGKEDQKPEGKYLHTVKCQKKKIIPQFFNERIEIKILKYNKKEGGLFEKSYITYEILVMPMNLKVERRYSDFEWLKEKLNFLYSGSPIPPISRKGQFRRYDDKHLTKRQIILEMFLNKLVSIPELKSQEIVHEFLTIKESNVWEKFKSKYKGLLSDVEMGRVCNIQGEVTCQINKNLTGFLMQTQKYLTQIQPCVKKIYKDFKACATSLEACSETFKTISTNCKNIWNYDNQFRTGLKLPLLENNLFSNFQLISEQYSDLLVKQAKLLRNQMYGLVKYESMFMINLVQSLQGLAEKQQTFTDVRVNLLKRKLKLYELNDLSKWGCQNKITQKPKTKQQAFAIMLPKETEEAKKLRDTYALYNRQIYKECLRYFKQTNRHIAKYVRNYIQSQSRLNSEGMMLWADLLSNAMGMQQDKSIKYTMLS